MLLPLPHFSPLEIKTFFGPISPKEYSLKRNSLVKKLWLQKRKQKQTNTILDEKLLFLNFVHYFLYISKYSYLTYYEANLYWSKEGNMQTSERRGETNVDLPKVDEEDDVFYKLSSKQGSIHGNGW